MDIAKWVRAARKHKGWTQPVLGEKLAVTKGNVSGWERGRHEPGFNQVLRIAKETGYPLFDSGPSGPWPFSPELLAAARRADAAVLRNAENAARACLDMDALPRQANELAA